MTTIPNDIQDIAATAGNNNKVAMLTAAIQKHGQPLIDILHWVYDSFKTFGIEDTKALWASYQTSSAFMAGLPNTTGFNNVLIDLSMRKDTGMAARARILDMLENYKVDEDHADLFMKILKKDLRFKMGCSLVNKSLRAAGYPEIYEYDCMLAHPFEPKRFSTTNKYIAEDKLDGMRAQVWVDVDYNSADFKSRNGNEITSVNAELQRQVHAFVEENELLRDNKYVVEGELEATTENFADTISSARKKATQDNLVFTIFDILTVDEFNGLSQTPLSSRLERLEEFNQSVYPNLRVNPGVPVASVEEVYGAYADARARGKEGIILKDLDHPYEPKRSYGWMKIKGEETADVPIKALKPGKEGTKYEGMLGAYVVDFDGVEVDVGSGISDADRLNPPHGVGDMIEVEFHEKTPDGSMRHPRYVRGRPDKDVK